MGRAARGRGSPRRRAEEQDRGPPRPALLDKAFPASGHSLLVNPYPAALSIRRPSRRAA
ncbi:MAG: hypothetical protein MZV64_63255 [Ignavibacteriales bacterium]|nr:hypothetical protein [Ignavibacteriales bacterium]